MKLNYTFFWHRGKWVQCRILNVIDNYSFLLLSCLILLHICTKTQIFFKISRSIYVLNCFLFCLLTTISQYCGITLILWQDFVTMWICFMKKTSKNVAFKNSPNVIENYQMYRRMSESQERHIFVTLFKNAMYISCTFRAVASKENICFIFLSLFVILWTFHFQYPITKDIKYKYILQDDMSTIKFSLFLKPLTWWFLDYTMH